VTRVWLPGKAFPVKGARPWEKQKRKKYGNTKIVNEFGKFDSGHEWARFQKLWLLQRAGLISELKLQVKFVLVPGVKLAGEKRKKPDIRYFADFVYIDKNGLQVIEDAKSEATRKTKDYRQKKHLMKSILNLDIVEV